VAYQALYREWRPATFSEVSGQEHIKRTLANMLNQNRIAHALLFCGPRGTGKTTMAKILAKAVNCREGVSAEPCLKCSACLDIAKNASMDVLEIDAASNRGIDEIRELREHVKFAPADLRYKVYIIDEVHMLTTEAFNALLKTLEEPPNYVLFILATTEPHKLPATIISRCQRFDFRRLSHDSVVKRLQEVAGAKGVSLNTEAAKLIAEQSQGGMRDALGMLEQCISFAEGDITQAAVETITGSVPTAVFQRLLSSMVSRDVAHSMELLHEELNAGREAHQYLKSYIAVLRLLLLAANSPQVLLMQGYELTGITELAQDLKQHLPDFIDLAIATENSMRFGGHPRLHLELLLVRQFKLLETSAQLEAVHRAEPALAPMRPVAPKVPKDAVPPAAAQAPAPSSSQTPQISALLKAWPDVVKAIKQRAPLTGAMMGGLSPLRMEGSVVILQLSEHNVHTFKRLSNNADLAHIAVGFEAVLGRPVEVKLMLPNPTGAETSVPNSRDQVKEVLDIFQGTIVKD